MEEELSGSSDMDQATSGNLESDESIPKLCRYLPIGPFSANITPVVGGGGCTPRYFAQGTDDALAQSYRRTKRSVGLNHRGTENTEKREVSVLSVPQGGYALSPW